MHNYCFRSIIKRVKCAYKISMSSDVLYCLNVDVNCIIAHKIWLKCELLVSKDLFFWSSPFLLKYVDKIHGKGSFY